jgi:arylsulfatase A-like enzyme
MPKKKVNLILVGIDSLRADHMSLYGYDRLTTPHMDKFTAGGTVFENTLSPHIPTTSAYSNMLTGMDCFGTDVVALRHQGTFAKGVVSLPEILKKEGYNTTCVGFEGNPAARGFAKYINYASWGSWEEGRSPKADRLNEVTIPELERLGKSKKPFFLFLRHMDPHSPYLPPEPFHRMFYGGNEFDPKNKSMKPVFEFKPFCDYFACWMPPGVTDKDYINAQYDGAIAYMDACIQNIFTAVSDLGLEDDTLIVIDSDHGETLYDHDCYYDHHGLYDPTLNVPLVFRLPGKVPSGLRLPGATSLKAVTPTILDILGIKTKIKFDGQNLFPEMKGRRRKPESELYITECTWMRKHGWRTPEWKLIHALEPDFHFKPEVELYNLIDDPEENNNVAKKEKKLVAMLEERMQDYIAKREKETGRTNPMYTNLHWHGHPEIKRPFKSSQEAYDSMHIGDPEVARKLQAKAAKE